MRRVLITIFSGFKNSLSGIFSNRNHEDDLLSCAADLTQLERIQRHHDF